MRFLILGDPHGIIPAKIKKLRHDAFDAIICTGDFVPDLKLRKIIFSAIRRGLNWRMTISEQKLAKIATHSEARGMKVLSWLQSIRKPVYFIPGNWDISLTSGEIFYKKKIAKMKTRMNNLVDCDMRLVDVDATTCIIGYGRTSGPELRADRGITPHDRDHFSLLCKKFDKLFALAKKRKQKVIFLTHNPPIDTKLDRINYKASPAHGKHFGSQLSRKMIEKHKPLICICGHMHENRGLTKLKTTTCFNAGCLRERGFFILKERGKIEKLKPRG